MTKATGMAGKVLSSLYCVYCDEISLFVAETMSTSLSHAELHTVYLKKFLLILGCVHY